MTPKNKQFLKTETGRRQFISNAVKATAAAAMVSSPFINLAANPVAVTSEITVGAIMDAFINEVPGAPFASTVDTLKAGNRDLKVKGIITTMFATLELIQKTIDAGANFIIAHEPTFYNHADDTKWLENDEVFRYKSELLRKHQIAIWRNHDYIHRHMPDGVATGVLAKLGWTNYYHPTNNTAIIPAIP